jgi:hypothetical protein
MTGHSPCPHLTVTRKSGTIKRKNPITGRVEDVAVIVTHCIDCNSDVNTQAS